MKLNYIYVYLRGDLLLKFKISYINEPAGVRLYSLHRTPVTILFCSVFMENKLLDIIDLFVRLYKFTIHDFQKLIFSLNTKNLYTALKMRCMKTITNRC